MPYQFFFIGTIMALTGAQHVFAVETCVLRPDESVRATQFFMLISSWNDTVLDKNFQPMVVSIFYPEQHDSDVTKNEHKKLSVYQLQIHQY